MAGVPWQTVRRRDFAALYDIFPTYSKKYVQDCVRAWSRLSSLGAREFSLALSVSLAFDGGMRLAKRCRLIAERMPCGTKGARPACTTGTGAQPELPWTCGENKEEGGLE